MKDNVSKNKIYYGVALHWVIILLFLAVFFLIFWKLSPPVKPIENKVKLLIEISPKSVDTDTSNIIAVKLKVENPTNISYPSEDYFYRVVVNRSYPDSPGFIIKEFSKTLELKSRFESEFLWKEEYLPSDKKLKFWIHFNMYKRDKNNEPKIMSADTKVLYEPSL